MRRAEPVGRLAAGGDLSPALAAELLDKRLRGVAQIEIDLPDVNLQAVPMGSGHALGHLVAILTEGVALRQEFAGIIGPAGPKLIGQHHVEPACLQCLGRSFPVARIGPRAGMVPKSPPSWAGSMGLTTTAGSTIFARPSQAARCLGEANYFHPFLATRRCGCRRRVPIRPGGPRCGMRGFAKRRRLRGPVAAAGVPQPYQPSPLLK